MSSYDDALFRQLLEKRCPDRVCSLSDVHVVLAQAAPEFDTDDADIQDFTMEEIVPGVARLLQQEGWRIVEYDG